MTVRKTNSKKSKFKNIVVCTSASFYKQVLKIQKELEHLGFKVSVPLTARKMEKAGNYDVSFYKTWFKNPNDYNRKSFLMRNHINRVLNGTAVLVVNLKKNNISCFSNCEGNQLQRYMPTYEENLMPRFPDSYWLP